MINWKVCIGLSLLMIAGIELLKIKDYYHADRLTPSVIWLITAFTLSVFTAAFLILNGLEIHKRLRHVTHRKATSRTREIRSSAIKVHGAAVVIASAPGI